MLEIGCGYGYLTSALRHAGFDAHGIDISATAVAEATARFGPWYTCSSVESFSGHGGRGRYDLVVETEVIEHVPDPTGFVRSALEQAAPGGCLLLTTPNKDYAPSGAGWQTDAPPVHLTWLGFRSLERVAKGAGAEIQLVDMSGLSYCVTAESRLLPYLRTRRSPVWSGPLLDGEGRPVPRMSESKAPTRLRWQRRFLRTMAVSVPCNVALWLVSRRHHGLGVVLRVRSMSS